MCALMSFLLRKLYVLYHSEPEMLSTLQPYIKAKWCDTAYFLAQDLNIESERDVRLIVTRLAVMAFVCVTCCRTGSAANKGLVCCTTCYQEKVFRHGKFAGWWGGEVQGLSAYM